MRILTFLAHHAEILTCLTIIAGLIGFFVNGYITRRLEYFKLKVACYQDFITTMEMCIPVTGIAPTDDEVKNMNRSFALVSTFAPDHILRAIYTELTITGKVNRDDFRKITLILHDDLHHPNRRLGLTDWLPWQRITYKHLMFVPFTDPTQ